MIFKHFCITLIAYIRFSPIWILHDFDRYSAIFIDLLWWFSIFIDFHIFSQVHIDFRRYSSKFKDSYRLEWIFIYCYYMSLIRTDVRIFQIFDFGWGDLMLFLISFLKVYIPCRPQKEIAGENRPVYVITTIYIYRHMYSYILTYTSIYIYIHTYIYICISTCIHMYVVIYIVFLQGFS